MEWIFWLSLILVFYPYVGYPLLLALLSFFNKLLSGSPRVSKKEPVLPSVSLVLVVHNEEARVLERIENLLQADYAKVVEVLVICDRCDDNTGPIAAAATGPIKAGGIEQWVRVVELKRGKDGRAAGLNQAVAIAKGDVVVFADIDQRFEGGTVAQLVAPFVDKKVGAVTGWLELGGPEHESAAKLDVYGELEKMMGEKESDLGATLFCHRAIYAVRGDVYEAIDEDCKCDELVIPMKIALSGHRVVFVPAAKVYQLQSSGDESDWLSAKSRVPLMAGQWQVLFRYPAWLLPWVNPLAWQLISHIHLRLLGPLFLLVLMVSNLVLLGDSWFYWLSFFGQLAVYALGLTGLLKVSFPWEVAELLSRMAGGFIARQALSALAFVHWLQGRVSALKKTEAEASQ